MPKIELTYAEWQVVMSCMLEFRHSVYIDTLRLNIQSQLDGQEC